MQRVILTLAIAAAAAAAPAAGANLTKGKPEIRSMSALAFGPDGILFVGDSRGGGVFAVDTGDRTERTVKDPKPVTDVEGKLAAWLTANGVGFQ